MKIEIYNLMGIKAIMFKRLFVSCLSRYEPK